MKPLLVLLPFLVLLPLPLTPPRHGDFDHFTLALTWQAGMCDAEKCVALQPKTPLIGLHGLWPSLPESLRAQGVVNPQWWSRGCDYYERSDARPPIGASLRERLEAIMPHLHYDLLTHEYDKHVQCFGYDATSFFTTALAMREGVVQSAFGAYLMQQAGHEVDHADVVHHFQKAFGTDRKTALQLRCEKIPSGELVFAQFWMTIPAGRIGEFPNASAFMETSPRQDSCPSRFRVPDWNV